MNPAALIARFAAELACTKTKHKMQRCGFCADCQIKACKLCGPCMNKEKGNNTIKQKCCVKKSSDEYVTGCKSCKSKKNRNALN